MTFTIQRGINISHWLSQCDGRGQRQTWFTQKDVAYLADLGFDHLRIPVDEKKLWLENGRFDPEALDLLNQSLDWCEAAGLRAIIDLHILRSHYFLDDSPELYRNPAAQAQFVGLWRELSGVFNGRSPDLVAYELLNEAVAPDPEDWNKVAHMAFHAVRELEPERTIVLGSNHFCQAHTFSQLAVPDDPNCILTYHYYNPMLITHYTAPWWQPGATYAGPVQYPGQPIPAAAWAALTPDFQAQLQSENEPFTRDTIVAGIAQPLAVRERTGHALYCGEFGAYEKSPQPLRLAWYRDMISVFAEFGIAWASWDYMGDFGIVTPSGVDTGLAAVLLNK
jgi:endoglucanase